MAGREGPDSKKAMLDNQLAAVQESVLRQEITVQRNQDTLNNMTAMMQWQVNRQFRKDRETAMARIPNPDAVVQQLDLNYGPPPGLAWPYQENPLVAQQNQPEPQPIPPLAAQHDQPLALQPEPPAVLPYRPRRMDPNPFPPPARGRRGRRGNNLFANHDRNRPGANWRNHLDIEEQEGHREEPPPRPYRAEPRIDYIQPEQGQNPPPVNALNDIGALQRVIREIMEPEARRGERPTYRKPYPAYIDQIPLPPGFKVPNFTLFNGEDPHASSVEHMGRDWIHQSLCIPSTLHQQLALWNEEGHMEIVEADPRPFLPSAMCLEARYYHDDLGPFTFFGVNQNGRPHGVTAQRLIEEGLASSLEDWNRPFCAKLPEL
ncbi:hypothetical protein L3X38_017739 [Prunus dulcis]|uniref:Uncharacterized protein n=1 Tax=Prunus dulcis TaxID=3755 RepID=A0AAD4ZB03_PRUDU|nr:hypothetical protein L3X38_017739 [Prunus dulcis]